MSKLLLAGLIILALLLSGCVDDRMRMRCLSSKPEHVAIAETPIYSLFGQLEGLKLKLTNSTSQDITIEAVTRIDETSDVFEIEGTLPKKVPLGESFELNLNKGKGSPCDISGTMEEVRANKCGLRLMIIDYHRDSFPEDIKESVNITCTGNW